MVIAAGDPDVDRRWRRSGAEPLARVVLPSTMRRCHL